MTSARVGVPNTSEQLDASLVERARRGDGAAFAALVDRHLEDAFRIASVLVGTSAAELAIEDAFVAAWHELPRLPDAAEFGPWLESIVVGACAMDARRASPSDHARGTVGEGPRRDAGDGLGREEALRLLEDAFERLEPSDRAVLVLHDLAGRSVAEIARIVHEPPGPVRVRIAESKATLLRALEADG